MPIGNSTNQHVPYSVDGNSEGTLMPQSYVLRHLGENVTVTFTVSGHSIRHTTETDNEFLRLFEEAPNNYQVEALLYQPK